jgi:DNA (cytosine-5)-methyltransferase 1
MSDVAAIGYDAEWTVQSAASVGAPHKRDRIWILLYAGEVGRIRRDRGQDSGTARGGEVQTIGCSHGEKPEMGQANRGSVQGQRSHWTHKPEIPLVVNGFPGQLVGLMAIGNAIVPQVAEVILKAIKEVDRV